MRDKIREAGFPKPRIEGEDNGEWIIVDCGPAVVHVMQPAIRQYYHLEEIWGEKPVRSKLGATKPSPAKKVSNPVSTPAKKTSRSTASGTAAKKTVPKSTATKTTAKKAPAKKTASRQK